MLILAAHYCFNHCHWAYTPAHWSPNCIHVLQDTQSVRLLTYTNRDPHKTRFTDKCITGTLPSLWGNNGSFPALVTLQIDGVSAPNVTTITGRLPAEWGSPTAFQQLQRLQISNCSITGDRVTSMWPVCGCIQCGRGVMLLACQ